MKNKDMSVRERLIAELQVIVKKLGGDFVPVVEFPADLGHGDYTTNAAMALSGRLKRSSIAIAEEIAEKSKIKNQKSKIFEKIEVVKPGFVNFWLSQDFLYTELNRLTHYDTLNIISDLTDKRIIVEYGHPNTHKEIHIGHMRTLITGEALARIFEAAGVRVFRANYQGDIGPHVAKALYGISRILEEKGLVIADLRNWTDREKAHFLGAGYVRGNKDYEEHKEKIDEINKRLYEKDDSIMPLYEKTRQWSLDYYDDFYKRFYTKFDKLFFESEVAERGKKIVEENTGKVFVKDNGAIIFPGEKYGLHTRVFITQGNNPTYEGKEMGLAYEQYAAFPFDKNIHVVANEQKGYFEVVIKALEVIDPEKFKGREHHLSMGMVQMLDPSSHKASTGQVRKMSSRTGDILTVDWLIDEVRSRVNDLITEQKISAEEVDRVTEQIAIGAIKYSVLRVATSQNVAFDIEKSVSLTGNSGPYLQYTYARTQSVLRKSKVKSQKSKVSHKGTRFNEPSQVKSQKLQNDYQLREEEVALLRLLVRFEGVVREAAEKYAPNIICNYLYILAQAFNLFYQKLPILKETGAVRDLRLALTAGSGKVLRSGLELLGIKAPERM